jgi:hypothetical protein
MRAVFIALLWLIAAPWPQRAPTPPATSAQPGFDPLTLDDARPIIDNERVRVWDFTWTKGIPAAMDRQTYDSVWIALAPSAGNVVYWKKGAERTPPTRPGRTIVIDLKDRSVPPLENKSGFPNAFPRPGSVKQFENDRIVVWDYTWTLGQPTPMHFHDKDVVVVYLKNGDVRSTTPDGQSVVNQFSAGMTRFNARDRVHTEQLVKGESRAVITELK